MKRSLHAGALILSGALTALAFPSASLWPLVLVGLVPLLVSLEGGAWPPPVLAGLAWGSGFFACLLSWLYRFFRHYGGLDTALSLGTLAILVSYLALYPALFALLAAQWQRRFPAWTIWLLPSLWVTLEWVRGHFLSGFPWGSAGYALIGFIPGVQVASLAGVYGVSFLVILVNVLLGGWILRLLRGRRIFLARDVAPIVMIGAALGWGLAQLRNSPARGEVTRLGIVQANIPQDQKWSAASARSILETHERMTEQCAAAGAALVLWPESSSPFPITLAPAAQAGGIRPNAMYRERLESLAKRLGIEILFGTADYRVEGGEVRPVNAAALVRSDGTWGETYAKMHLVPFGEYVPLGALLSFVNRLAQGAIGDFVPGKKAVVVQAGPLKLGTAICYEMIFPELVRRFAANGATVLVNLTNDAWFGTSSGPYQHFQMVRMRAVENRRYVVRAANTGVSAVVDPAGRVAVSTPLQAQRVLSGEVRSRSESTFYVRHGDWFAILCAILAAAALAAQFSWHSPPKEAWSARE
jgi:apolipoprotein N-acyltransferase